MTLEDELEILLILILIGAGLYIYFQLWKMDFRNKELETLKEKLWSLEEKFADNKMQGIGAVKGYKCRFGRHGGEEVLIALSENFIVIKMTYDSGDIINLKNIELIDIHHTDLPYVMNLNIEGILTNALASIECRSGIKFFINDPVKNSRSKIVLCQFSNQGERLFLSDLYHAVDRAKRR